MSKSIIMLQPALQKLCCRIQPVVQTSCAAQFTTYLQLQRDERL